MAKMYHSPLHTPPEELLLPLSAVQHFSDKLIHIHERLKTEPGRVMGQKRHKLVSTSHRFQYIYH